ncbi:helix-turn-helix domain-containing protein [Brevibacterium permense]|uniref:helix-turn-helix domain-containing protein n=1 Tax=Brevibacterium permense TaxID=234834 RepID=UPI0021D166CD|nr:helix-turn-helix domain-containing protein [Brevibacterium permense]MCU4295495.1 helix-turn-helix domain-containing protein [Brevibacterium permense]
MHKLDCMGTGEAAERLSVDRSTLSRWVKSGKLVPIIRGNGKTGEMFFAEDEIERVAELRDGSKETTK